MEIRTGKGRINMQFIKTLQNPDRNHTDTLEIRGAAVIMVKAKILSFYMESGGKTGGVYFSGPRGQALSDGRSDHYCGG
jgi:hypothetical protein